MSDDKVVSINKNTPAREYPGASGAIKALLEQNGFDQQMIDKDWVEIRIIARFTDRSALFHTVQARQVTLTERQDPSETILKMVAAANGWQDNVLVAEATAEEADKLRSLLETVNEDLMLKIVLQDEGWEDEIDARNLHELPDILEAVFNRYQMKVSKVIDAPEPKKEYETPKLTPMGSITDNTASGSGRFCPNGKPKPPTGNCGH